MTAEAAPEPTALPERLLAFYGDDFTGSSAVMEVMSFAGLPTILFLQPPDAAILARYPGYRGIGVASTARARPPEWMDRHLPDAFRALQALGAAVNHYKICSTFDSAPGLGSIGRAIEIGRGVFGDSIVPLVTAAPAIGRYQAFGNLFAAFGGAVHRLDRHPVMHRHPATPMDEADLARHLARQTALPVGLVDLLALKSGRGQEVRNAAEKARAGILSIDVVDEETLQAAGALVWSMAGRTPPLFVAGSQGIEYALIAHFRAAGLLPPPPPLPRLAPVDQIVAVSGSVSPTTAAQIAAAEGNGFAVIAVDAAASVEPRRWQQALDEAESQALDAIARGASPLLATARGPDDPAVAAFGQAVATSGLAPNEAQSRIGTGLGRLLRDLVSRAELRRAVVSGGDTSGFALSAMAVDALAAKAPLAPGAPLCEVGSGDASLDGLELALKGGQMGNADFFVRARDGDRSPLV